MKHENTCLLSNFTRRVIILFLQTTFLCSFGYDVVKILVKGQGGLPNCIETRLDIPSYVERNVRSAYRSNVIYLSKDHITLPIMPTHSLTREIIAITNDTENLIRFIWLPERVANIINIVMTPWWGVIQPKSTEWITMTVYTLQEPATFTTTISCEILDLTERRRYQRNEHLRKAKIEQCNQEFIITEEGLFHPGINDNPPYVLDIAKPQSLYLAMSISISSKGQRDGYPRMLLKQMWEQTPPYDLSSTEMNTQEGRGELTRSSNNMAMSDIMRIIEGIIWDALHSKLFKCQIEHYTKEEIPTYEQLVATVASDSKPKFSKRITSGICDAIVNKAIFNVFGLNSKSGVSILEAE